jgi:hypothetical protein
MLVGCRWGSEVVESVEAMVEGLEVSIVGDIQVCVVVQRWIPVCGVVLEEVVGQKGYPLSIVGYVPYRFLCVG